MGEPSHGSDRTLAGRPGTVLNASAANRPAVSAKFRTDWLIRWDPKALEKSEKVRFSKIGHRPAGSGFFDRRCSRVCDGHAGNGQPGVRRRHLTESGLCAGIMLDCRPTIGTFRLGKAAWQSAHCSGDCLGSARHSAPNRSHCGRRRHRRSLADVLDRLVSQSVHTQEVACRGHLRSGFGRRWSVNDLPLRPARFT